VAADAGFPLRGENVLSRQGKFLPQPVADELLRHADRLGQSALVPIELSEGALEASHGHDGLLQNYCDGLQQEYCSGGATNLFVGSAAMDAASPDEIKRLRKERGWSQAQLVDRARAIAEKDGYPGALTQQSLANYEAGKMKRTPTWLRYVVDALGDDGHRIQSEVEPIEIDDPIRHKFGTIGLPTIPLLGTVMAGEWNGPERHVEMTELDLGEVLAHLPRPVSLKDDKEAYAVTIVGDSMWPRFRPGRRVIVSPRSTPSIGDDVIVQLLGQPDDNGDRRIVQVLIKELVRRSANHVELRQFNPDVTFKLEKSEIASIHKVAGELF
jgi:SOS-response transcriptional repressor LexA